jgi:hypothetical protein
MTVERWGGRNEIVKWSLEGGREASRYGIPGEENHQSKAARQQGNNNRSLQTIGAGTADMTKGRTAAKYYCAQ